MTATALSGGPSDSPAELSPEDRGTLDKIL